MALRTVPTHPKFLRLKRLLSCGLGEALGYLEALWHFTAAHAQCGDVGRFADADIEQWIEWRGESGALVAALVEAGWLDRCGTHRLVVHDWADHCDRSVKLSIRRRGVQFVDSAHVADLHPTSERDVGLPGPGPGPGPEPEPEPFFCSEPAADSEPQTAIAVAPPQRPPATTTTAPPPDDDDPEVLRFPVQGRPGEWSLRQSRVDEYRQLYPAIDVAHHCKAARQWALDNPQRRKTAKGMPRFLTAWLARVVDRGGDHGYAARAAPPVPPRLAGETPEQRAERQVRTSDAAAARRAEAAEWDAELRRRRAAWDALPAEQQAARLAAQRRPGVPESAALSAAIAALAADARSPPAQRKGGAEPRSQAG